MDIFELIERAPPLDPLSEETRKQRRSLLAASLLAIALTAAGLAPQQIEALGISLSATEQVGLLLLLAAAIGYFLASFLIYGIPELINARGQDQLYRQLIAEFVAPTSQKLSGAEVREEILLEASRIAAHAKIAGSARFGKPVRLAFDFGLPPIVALFAEALLLSHAAGLPGFSFRLWYKSPGVLILGLTAVTLVVVGTHLAMQRYRATASTRMVRRFSKETSRITEELKRATRYPEGSPERAAAQRRVEQMLEDLGRRKPPGRK